MEIDLVAYTRGRNRDYGWWAYPKWFSDQDLRLFKTWFDWSREHELSSIPPYPFCLVTRAGGTVLLTCRDAERIDQHSRPIAALEGIAVSSGDEAILRAVSSDVLEAGLIRELIQTVDFGDDPPAEHRLSCELSLDEARGRRGETRVPTVFRSPAEDTIHVGFDDAGWQHALQAISEPTFGGRDAWFGISSSFLRGTELSEAGLVGTKDPPLPTSPSPSRATSRARDYQFAAPPELVPLARIQWEGERRSKIWLYWERSAESPAAPGHQHPVQWNFEHVPGSRAPREVRLLIAKLEKALDPVAKSRSVFERVKALAGGRRDQQP